MSISQQDVIAGQRAYTKRTLGLYDWLVLGFSNRFIWRCPTSILLNLYDVNVTGNHLDVGVGTGFFLDRCRFPTESPRVALLDLNQNCLDAAAARIGRYDPEVFRQDLFQPFSFQVDGFDSIGLNYVLHCLPGTMADKSAVIDHLLKLLNPSGALFGSTILCDGVPRSFLARRLMRFYNKRQIFSNSEDTLKALNEMLGARFGEVTIDTTGCVARFVAKL